MEWSPSYLTLLSLWRRLYLCQFSYCSISIVWETDTQWLTVVEILQTVMYTCLEA